MGLGEFAYGGGGWFSLRAVISVANWHLSLPDFTVLAFFKQVGINFFPGLCSGWHFFQATPYVVVGIKNF